MLVNIVNVLGDPEEVFECVHKINSEHDHHARSRPDIAGYRFKDRVSWAKILLNWLQTIHTNLPKHIRGSEVWRGGSR